MNAFSWSWGSHLQFRSQLISYFTRVLHKNCRALSSRASHTCAHILTQTNWVSCGGAQGLKGIVKRQLISGFNDLILPRWPFTRVQVNTEEPPPREPSLCLRGRDPPTPPPCTRGTHLIRELISFGEDVWTFNPLYTHTHPIAFHPPWLHSAARRPLRKSSSRA